MDCPEYSNTYYGKEFSLTVVSLDWAGYKHDYLMMTPRERACGEAGSLTTPPGRTDVVSPLWRTY
jgi:hypothetical protein